MMAGGAPINVLFRADASLQIGTGHVMRCLALAAALRERGAVCRFVCREHAGNLIDVIRRSGYEACLLPMPDPHDDRPRVEGDDAPSPTHAAWLGGDWQTDAREARAVAGGTLADWLVVDHYALDVRWERAMRAAAAHLMIIDDLADRPHDCDLLLDQNLGREASEYETLTPPGCELVLGPSHALLRPEFVRLRERSLARRQRPKLGRLLISLGGVDKDNLTCRVLDALRSSTLPAECVITVVMGAMAPALSIVQANAASMPWLTEVRVDVQDMAALMAESDLAIGAAGGTTWERCCMGVPTLMVVAAENQREVAAAMEASNAAWNLGEATDDGFEKAMMNAIARFAHKPGALRRMSERASALTNGEGASRVADMMMSVAMRTQALASAGDHAMSHDALRLRPADMADAELLLAWRNEPSTRQASHNGTTIEREDHLRWLRASLASSTRSLFVAELDGVAVGTVRVDDEAACHVLSWTVPSVKRGSGIGKAMVRLLADSIHGELRAEIRQGNIASVRIAEAAGLRLVREVDGILHYRRSATRA